MTQYSPTEYHPEAAGRSWTPRDVLMMLFRRRWVILGIALPIIVFAIYGTLTTVDSYFAESQVLLETRNPEDPTFRNLGVDYDILMSTASQVASSIPVAERAAITLMDSLPALKASDPHFANVDSEAEMVDILGGGVRCSQVGESNILSIGFSSHSARFSLMAVAAITEAYITFTADSKNNPAALDYYTEQINIVLANVDDLLAQRTAIFKEGGLSAFKQNNTAGINNMREMEYNYLKTKSDRKTLEDRIRDIKLFIVDNPDYAPLIQGTNSANMSGALSNLNDAKLKLAALRLSYNDSSIHVVRQREYIERARDIFVAERNSYVANLEQELHQIRVKEREQLAAYSGYKADILAYPGIENQIQTIDIRIASRRDLLETLELKRGEIRIKSESDLRVSNIVPLNKPSMGASIGGGKKMIYLVLAGFLALALGLVAALFIDVNDHRIYDGRQAQNFLNLPVLGAISEIESTGKRS